MQLSVSQVTLLHTSHSAACEVDARKRGAVQTGRWVGRSLVGTFVADWQGGEAQRNVPTLRFREVAHNVLPAGSAFEEVCVFV